LVKTGLKTGVEYQTVRVLPEDVAVRVEKGVNLLEAIAVAGVRINARCGGSGSCGKCRIMLKDGDLKELEGKTPKLTQEDREKGYRLACRCEVVSDLVIEVPEESRVKKLAESEKQTLGGRVHVSPCEFEDVLAGKHEPPVKKFYLELTEPTLQDNLGDLTRLTDAVKREHGLEIAHVDLGVLRKMPAILREDDWKVTVSVLCEGTLCDGESESCTFNDCRNLRIVRIEPGDTTGRLTAAAVDLGTDVISRLVYSLKDGQLEQLQKPAADSINGLLKGLLEQAGLDAGDISFFTVAGNTTMTQLLAGIFAKYIRESPYVPTINALPWLRAAECGIEVPQEVPMYFMPAVASYVGGDIVSGIVGYGLARKQELTLYMDLGTNGEIVVGNRDLLMTASASAGPALEGGGLKCGMRAAEGAVQDFYIDPETGDPVVLTIGNRDAVGFCGSGVIALVAELLRFGIVQPNGKFNQDAETDRLRKGEDGIEYVIVKKEDSGTDSDIVITEADLDNIVRAKGAVYAACQTLLSHVGYTFDMIERVVITGSFGNYIDIQSAIFIGLLPDMDPSRICFIKNGSLLGARLATYSAGLMTEAEKTARSMTNIELSEDPSFMDNYMAAMFLPHTDGALFPNVTAVLDELRGATA